MKNIKVKGLFYIIGSIILFILDYHWNDKLSALSFVSGMLMYKGSEMVGPKASKQQQKLIYVFFSILVVALLLWGYFSRPF